MFNLKRVLYKLNAKLLTNIGNDLRQAGYLIGIGFVGLIVPTQNISAPSAAVLLMYGFYSWIIGHYCLYLSDKIDLKSNKGDPE
ncbi:TPA: hypothetical protein ACU18R_002441 [Mannheimia haemolytica]